MSRYQDSSTWAEIKRQPQIWEDWWGELEPRLPELKAWINAQNVDEIWLSGAGTSAYIGDFIAAGLNATSPIPIRAVASTDLVSAPHQFLSAKRPLVVNFGRSGDSAESIGVLDLLDALAPDTPRLNITCNPEGALATREAPHQRIIALPELSHDVGFAMTSSFSTMVLTALALFDPHMPKDAFQTLTQGARSGFAAMIARGEAMETPTRMVFLGSGLLKFAAREASLKILELTSGDIPVIWDSSMGFRHGPKSFVKDGTHIVMMTSSDPDIARYDVDLVTEIRQQFDGIPITELTGTSLPDRWGGLLQILPVQVMSVILSNRLNYAVDNPFEGQGTLTRVVSGVKLYAANPKT